jgi:hypothetical protein
VDLVLPKNGKSSECLDFLGLKDVIEMRRVPEPLVTQIIRSFEEAFRVHHQANRAVIDAARHHRGLGGQVTVGSHHAENFALGV